MYRVLAINPGATSTKLAVYDDQEPLFKITVEHQGKELAAFQSVFEQYSYRLGLIQDALHNKGIGLETIHAIVGRGGLLKPLIGGTYLINKVMIEDLKEASRNEHASNLGAILAFNLAQSYHVPAYIVDPVCVDEMDPVAKISGSPEFERISMSHALNMKAVSHKVARDMGRNYEDLRLVVAHLGTGVSLSAHSKGKMIDICDGREEGAFSLDRCGGLPANQLVNLCYSGKYTLKEIKDKFFTSGGIYAYIGTKDVREIEMSAAKGNKKADLLLAAFAYQVAKEIGALATVLEGNVDRIILTGGIAHSARIVGEITRRVQFISPVIVIPGEEELDALANGALRVLRGEELCLVYQ
ncbi:butyrate kinase [Anaerospora hongkongensis]|uniref:butyrate kinase n=1 Tax=Anaerospora hongkongensis TaxID=244830 RepID=UPI002FD88610